MADDEDRDAAPLGQGHQLAGTLPDLADTAGGRFQRVRIDGLDGINHHDPRFEPLYGRDDLFHRGLGKEHEVLRPDREPVAAEPDLPGRLLAGDIEGPSGPAGEPVHRLEHQGGLADTGGAADQDQRSRDEAASQHPVELRDAGDGPLLGSPGDVAEGSRSPVGR